MKVYIDTSAFLAVLNAGDEHHKKAAAIWLKLLDEKARLHTNSFVLLETYVLIQSRLGLEAVRTFTKDIYPLLCIEWVQNDLFLQGITSFLGANRKNLSLVDCTSFITMLKLKVNKAFTFDKHFSEQGFEIL